MRSDRAVGEARGVLSVAAPPGVHARRAPAPGLRPMIAHYWWVSWDVPAAVRVETLPHPTAHIVFDSSAERAVELSAVSVRRFERMLSGAGQVFGIKLRPGVIGTLAGGELTRFAAGPVALAGALASPVLEGALLALGSVLTEVRAIDEASDLSDATLSSVSWPSLSADAKATRDLVERIEHDRSLVRVSDVAMRAGLDVRTLERRFRRHVGLSPKAVIARYRLIEAAQRIQTDPGLSLSALAVELGYSDQAHFTRDFRGFVGRTPRALREACGTTGAEFAGRSPKCRST